jgi:hypothetical protein
VFTLFARKLYRINKTLSPNKLSLIPAAAKAIACLCEIQ